MSDWMGRSVVELAEAIAAGRVTSSELTHEYLGAARASELNAFIRLDEEGALACAAEVDQQVSQKQSLGPLAGVPIAVKDILCTRDLATTCGSRILEGFVPPYDATVVARLRGAGAVILGKTNLDEFAMGSSNENSAWGAVKNPHDPERVPGGSSGGSAVAVSANLAAAAIGTDTGGSIRQPASLCGCVGLKPTYGRVSRYGLIAFASSLDQAGPMTRTVEDAALITEVISGHDPRDSTSADVPVGKLREACTREVQGLRVGVPKQYFAEGLDDDVASVIRARLDDMRAAGAEIVEVELPNARYAVATYYVVATAEASSNLARYDGVRYGVRVPNEAGLLATYKDTRAAGFGPEVKRRIMLGTYVLSAGYYDAYYNKATAARGLIKHDFETAFQSCDVIAGPVSPTVAWPIGEKVDDPLAMYLTDIYTIGVNLAGLPGISVPAGSDPSGLPIGMQFVAPSFDEGALLRAASFVESL